MPQHIPFSHHCFVCGEYNRAGLRLKFTLHNNQQVRSDWIPAEHHQVTPERTHGGIIAAALDETMGWAAMLAMQRLCVTHSLTINYRHIVTIEQPHYLTATISERRGSRAIITHGELRNAQDKLCAYGTATYLKLSTQATDAVMPQLIDEHGKPPNQLPVINES